MIKGKTADDFAGVQFRKSSKSGAAGHCVEVGFLDGYAAVRDSKNRDGGMLVFTPDEWTAFTEGVEAGEFLE